MMHLLWNIFWVFWTVVFVLIGLIVACGRIDDWSDPNHKVGRKYKKTYFKE